MEHCATMQLAQREASVLVDPFVIIELRNSPISTENLRWSLTWRRKEFRPIAHHIHSPFEVVRPSVCSHRLVTYNMG